MINSLPWGPPALGQEVAVPGCFPGLRPSGTRIRSEPTQPGPRKWAAAGSRAGESWAAPRPEPQARPAPPPYLFRFSKTPRGEEVRGPRPRLLTGLPLSASLPRFLLCRGPAPGWRMRLSTGGPGRGGVCPLAAPTRPSFPAWGRAASTPALAPRFSLGWACLPS